MTSNTALHDALARLQDNPHVDGTNASQWLTAHTEDVMLLVAEKGANMAADLLGLSHTVLSSWRRRNGLLPSRSTAQRTRMQREQQAPPPPTVATGDYWRGQADAWQEIAHLALETLRYFLQRGTTP